MAKLTLASVDALRTRFADDAACEAALAAFADIAALRTPLRELVEAQHRYLQAEFEVAQVADVLRRDQKPASRQEQSTNSRLYQTEDRRSGTRQAMRQSRSFPAATRPTWPN
nr:hypothetical protein [Stenotrophomonas maltophilia]